MSSANRSLADLLIYDRHYEKVKHLVRGAERFFADWAFVQEINAFHRGNLDHFAEMVRQIHLPYPNTWLEWECGLEPETADLWDERFGYRPDVLRAASLCTETSPGIIEFSRIAQIGRAALVPSPWDRQIDLTADDNVMKSRRTRLAPTHMDRAFREGSPKIEQLLIETFDDGLTEVNIPLLILTYFNLVRDKITIMPSTPGKSLIGGQVRPLLTFRKLSITLPGIRAVLAERLRYIARNPPREHSVRGTWCCYDPGDTSCEHQMVLLDADHRRCPACGRFEGWRVPHRRGDPRRGKIQKEYHVKTQGTEGDRSP